MYEVISTNSMEDLIPQSNTMNVTEPVKVETAELLYITVHVFSRPQYCDGPLMIVERELVKLLITFSDTS